MSGQVLTVGGDSSANGGGGSEGGGSGGDVSIGNIINYSFSAAQLEPPGVNQVRFDQGYPYGIVTKVWVNSVSVDGQDVFAGLMVIKIGSIFVIQDKNDHTQFAKFTVTAAPISKDSEDYVEVPVAHLDHGNSLGGGQLVILQSTTA